LRCSMRSQPWSRFARRAIHPESCQSRRVKIFHFTEIRKRRMCCPSRLILEGRSYVVTNCEPGLRWTRQRRHERVRAGRVVPVSPKSRADERRCEVRRANMSMAACTALSAAVASTNARTAKPCGPGRRCYGQAFRGDVREPNRADGINSRGEGGQKESSAPGRARHKPSDHRAGKAVCWASPVCCCAVSLRYIFAQRTAGASRHPAFPAPSWIWGWSDKAKLGRIAPRDCEGVSDRW
jgi:hypothetical protein